MKNMSFYNSPNLIKLNGKTLFYYNLSLDENKLDIYNKAISEGKITDFDQIIITRLRKLYYGLYSGLIYMYMCPTTHNNMGDKVELLTHVLEDKDYNLIHGETNSTRSIDFENYDLEKLSFNSWLEVKEGNKTWVYDPFSLKKIEKEVYYKLENPKINQSISKSIIMNHPARDREDYNVYHDGFNEILIGVFNELEKNMNNHPFKYILSPEITRFKKEINFDDILFEWHQEESEIKKKS